VFGGVAQVTAQLEFIRSPQGGFAVARYLRIVLDPVLEVIGVLKEVEERVAGYVRVGPSFGALQENSITSVSFGRTVHAIPAESSWSPNQRPRWRAARTCRGKSFRCQRLGRSAGRWNYVNLSAPA
jgi:hypothetical protein